MSFLTGHAYMTDMKYEPRPSGASDSFWKMYFPLATFWDVLIFGFACVGFAVFVRRRNRTGIWMGVYCIVLVFGVYFGRESLPVIGGRALVGQFSPGGLFEDSGDEKSTLKPEGIEDQGIGLAAGHGDSSE